MKTDLFRFKQFAVDQIGCAMKVNTDGVLLGALTESNEPLSILDIGTGTGVIALMLAQRFPRAMIDALEPDVLAAATAESNFKQSVFQNRLALYTQSFQGFFQDHPLHRYDLIVSNPPFYLDALASPDAARTNAKHAAAGFFEQLINGCANHLTPNGKLWLILPLPASAKVKQLAEIYHLYAETVISLYSYAHSEPHRELLALGFVQTETQAQRFNIYNEPKHYSRGYQLALRDFLTIF